MIRRYNKCMYIIGFIVQLLHQNDIFVPSYLNLSAIEKWGSEPGLHVNC